MSGRKSFGDGKWAAIGTIVAAVIAAIAAIVVAAWQHNRGGEATFRGRVVDANTGNGIRQVKISLEAQGAPPIIYSDSEGFFFFPLENSNTQVRVRVKADGYEEYDRFITFSASSGVEEIQIQPMQGSPVQNPSNSIPDDNSKSYDALYGKIEEGRENLRLERFDLARSDFIAAQALDSQHPLPDFYIGLTYDREGNIDEADRYYEIAGEKYLSLQGSAAQLRTLDYDALVEICHVFSKDQKYESSLNLSSVALDIQKVSSEKRYAAYACRGTSLFWLDRGQADRKAAESDFNEALRIKESHLIYYNLGSLYAARFKDYSSAESAYKEALELQNDFIPAQRDLGFVYILSARLNEARELLEAIRGDASAEEGLRIIRVLETSSQSSSKTLSDILRLNVFGNFTVHDFEQDAILKDPHEHDHEHEE